MENCSKTGYTSCEIIEHGFDTQVDSINLCCRISKDKITDKLILINNYKGEKVDWEHFFKTKQDLIDVQKSGKTIPSCEGCIYLQNKQWDEEKYINTINFNNWIKCNADCIYCDRKQYKNRKEYKIYPLIKDLIDKKLLKAPCDITIAGGEPTVTSDFDKTLDILLKNEISTIRVLTNGIKYSKHIEKGLKMGLVNILVSVDSGSRETYKIIKRTDKYKQVWENLKKYAKIQKTNSLVKTKYIIIPGFNCNTREIISFINESYKNGITYVDIDFEIGAYCRYCNNLTFMQKIYDLYQEAKQEGTKLGITVKAFDRIQLIENKLTAV